MRSRALPLVWQRSVVWRDDLRSLNDVLISAAESVATYSLGSLGQPAIVRFKRSLTLAIVVLSGCSPTYWPSPEIGQDESLNTDGKYQSSAGRINKRVPGLKSARLGRPIVNLNKSTE
jgi:hypothetical protein